MSEKLTDAELAKELTRGRLPEFWLGNDGDDLLARAAARLATLSAAGSVPECFKLLLQEVTADPQAVACIDLRIIYACEAALTPYGEETKDA